VDLGPVIPTVMAVGCFRKTGARMRGKPWINCSIAGTGTNRSKGEVPRAARVVCRTAMEGVWKADHAVTCVGKWWCNGVLLGVVLVIPGGAGKAPCGPIQAYAVAGVLKMVAGSDDQSWCCFCCHWLAAHGRWIKSVGEVEESDRLSKSVCDVPAVVRSEQPGPVERV
jgi:hypothetical protein